MIKRFEFDFEGERISGTAWVESNGLLQIHENTLDLDDHISNITKACKDIEAYWDLLERLCEAFNQTKLFNGKFDENFLDFYVITMDQRMIEYPDDDEEDMEFTG